MKISELIKVLKMAKKSHGDLTVMFSGPNHDTSVYQVSSAEVHEGKGYPKSWHMPKMFVEIRN